MKLNVYNVCQAQPQSQISLSLTLSLSFKQATHILEKVVTIDKTDN